MPKGKAHKGLLKRVKVTARGKVKAKRSCGSHLNSHMTGKQTRQLRGTRYIKRADIGRIESMLGRSLRADR